VAKPLGAGVTSSTCSTLVVKWIGSASHTSYIVQGTYINPATNNIDTANATGQSCDGSYNCTATIPAVAGTIITWSIQAGSIINGLLTYSYPAIGVLPYPVASCTLDMLRFTGKVWLQGGFNTANSTLSTSLNGKGILQAQASSQPYTTAPYNYTGNESVGAGFFASHPDIVDWVLLELRDGNAPSSVVARRAAFVNKYGNVVDTGGVNSQITFPAIAKGNYYVVVRHRNHLAVRTAFPLDFNSDSASFDFTKIFHKTYDGGGNVPNDQLATLLVDPNVYALYGGNANGDEYTRKSGSASVNDYSLLLNAISSAPAPGPTGVYQREDFNMDGNVRKTGSPAVNDYSKLLSILAARTLIQQPSF
jgi:hypothetical protein